MQHELTAKKSLGQHFLSNNRIISAIVDCGFVAVGDAVLEIGPGTGVMTQELLARGARVCALELDDRAIELLTSKFAAQIKTGQCSIIHADAALGLPQAAQEFLGSSYKLIANIPYYITGLLLREFLTIDNQPQTIVFLMQREVAERIYARDGKHSILSLSVWAYGVPRVAMRVARGSFVPPPSVESAVLVITNISRSKFTDRDHENRFFEIIKCAFAQKRKTLGSTLSGYPDVLARMDSMNIARTMRPEDLEPTIWIELSK